MRRLELRPAARQDLRRLELFLHQYSPRAALRMFQTLTAKMLSLEQHPFKGHAGPTPNLRELIVRFGKSGYIIRYQVTDDAVIIVRIWHGRENRPR